MIYQTDKICPSCGRRLSQFYNDGMLGCPDCYKAFQSEIINSLPNFQGNTFHVGKTPRITGIDKQLFDEYKRLMKEKERAVSEGRFKDLAEITDDIKYLTLELKSRGLL